MSGFIYEKDRDGIVTVTMDMPGQPVNTMNKDYPGFLEETVERLEQDSIAGVILTSAKSTFFAGGDIKDMLATTPETLPQQRELNTRVKKLLRRFENLALPTVAAINGAALGGGYEMALACKYRIAQDHEKNLIGLPEVTLGLLPGAGGVVRLVRMLGIAKALDVLLNGRFYKAQEALSIGLVDVLTTSREEMLEQARSWIKAHPGFIQPWNRSDYQIPGGAQNKNPALQTMIENYSAQLVEKFGGAVPPAPKAIIEVAAKSLQLDVDAALQVEGDGFLGLVLTPEAKALMQAFVDKRK